MGFFLSGDWKLCGQAARREHVAVGEAFGLLLALIEEQPDLTLDEIVCAMRKQRISGSRTSVWRFFKRHDITFKKKPWPRLSGGEPHRRMLAAVKRRQAVTRQN